MPKPVYRSNPRLGPKQNFGRKVRDEVSGIWTYEERLIADDDGNQVDQRDRGTWDRRYDLDGNSDGGR